MVLSSEYQAVWVNAFGPIAFCMPPGNSFLALLLTLHIRQVADGFENRTILRSLRVYRIGALALDGPSQISFNRWSRTAVIEQSSIDRTFVKYKH